jgi:transcription elongation factor Elf1
MSSYIDLKFINEMSTRLQQFKRKSEYLYNFRCPYCGDSKKNKTKARAYFYRVKNDMFFKCHNCGEGHNLANVIKHIDQKLHDRYLLERYKSSAPSTQKPKAAFDFKPAFDSKPQKDYLSQLTKVSDLKENHPARHYVTDRMIPENHFENLYLCDKFMEFVNKVKPQTFPFIKEDHPRLIIPFFDLDGKFFAFQGRAFGNEQPKYLTIKLKDSKQKIYGLERVNLQEHINIVEGPIDSLFVKNCLAMGGADMYFDRIPAKNITYIFDNEPRNKEIVNRMYDVIDKNYNLVIWPDHIQSKDVNDMVMSGMNIDEVNNLISTNTFAGLEALTKLTNYKKC